MIPVTEGPLTESLLYSIFQRFLGVDFQSKNLARPLLSPIIFCSRNRERLKVIALNFSLFYFLGWEADSTGDSWRHPTDNCQCHLPTSPRLHLLFWHSHLHPQVNFCSKYCLILRFKRLFGSNHDYIVIY